MNLKLSLFIFLFLLLAFNFSSAEQGMMFQIDAYLNGETTSFYMITEEGASSGYSLVDVLMPDKEIAMPYFFSKVDGRELLMDVWDAVQDSQRSIDLEFQMTAGENFEGQLILSWNPISLQDSRGRYSLILKDYGEDSTRTNLVANRNLNQHSSYSTNNFAPNRYFTLEISYNYCGDGVIDAWEFCDGTNFGGLTCEGSGGVGSFFCNEYCLIDTRNCRLCGNGVVNREVGEECDGTNFGGESCTRLGYVSGTLSCIQPGQANECRLDKINCISQIGSPGPSPGGLGRTGGIGALCRNECTLGERRCVENNSYQICGNYDSDLCSEWGRIERCLGINPLCNQGFCFGCLRDSDCGEGICLNGRCETNCEKNCSELGLQCGKKIKCGRILNCGYCSEGAFCNAGVCSNLPMEARKILQKDCSPDYLCSPWSECKVSFDSEQLLVGTSWLFGRRERLCFDREKCYSTIVDEESCNLEINITAERREICGISYIEIYDEETNRLLARTRDSRYGIKRAIEIFLLPGQIDCEEERLPFELSWSDKILSFFNFRKIWGLFQ